MRELPGEEQTRQQPAADGAAVRAEQELVPGSVVGCVLSRRGGPAHQRGDPAHHGTHPRVGCRHRLEGGVHAGVDGNVGRPEEGDGGIHAKVEGRDANRGGQDCEEYGASPRDELADEGTVSCAAHHGIRLELVQHVQRVGRGGAERRPGGEEEESQRAERRRFGEGGREEFRRRVEGVWGHGGKDDEDGKSRFREGEKGRDSAAQRPGRLPGGDGGEDRRGVGGEICRVCRRRGGGDGSRGIASRSSVRRFRRSFTRYRGGRRMLGGRGIVGSWVLGKEESSSQLLRRDRMGS